MKRLLFILLAFVALSCSEKEKQSMKIGVDQTLRIPIEYVTISTGIVERGTEASSVEEKGYQKLTKVVNLLKEYGFTDDHLEINSGEVSNQQYRRDKPYRFTSSVTFDLTDLDKLDTFRRSLTKAGATNFRISSYHNSKEDSLYDVAYRQAIDKAKEKAMQLLDKQSVTVGKILNLHERLRETIEVDATFQMASAPMKLGSAAEMPPPVEPLFNKKFYTKNIEFNIEFALTDR